MPHRIWRHDCCPQSPDTSGSPTCQQCGAPGTFLGWELSSVEGMRRYREVYGLPPIGPHRKYVDSVLGPLRSKCPRCHGTGIVGSENEVGWQSCPVCEGTGGTWDASEDVLRAAYKAVRAAYPIMPLEAARLVALPLGLRPAERPLLPDPIWPAPGSGTPDMEIMRELCTPRAAETLTRGELRRAFIEAEEQLGRKWNLKDPGHCRRVSLKSHISRYVRPVVSCWQILTPAGASSPRRLYPLPIVLDAAQRLEVGPSGLIEREYR